MARAGCGGPSALLRTALLPAVATIIAGGAAYGVTLLTSTGWIDLVGGGLAGLAAYGLTVGSWFRRRLAEASAQWNNSAEAKTLAPGRHRARLASRPV